MFCFLFMNILDSLKASPVLEEVPDEQLNWLISLGTVKKLEPGDCLFQKGDPIDRLVIILSGKIELKVEQNGNFRTLNTLLPGEITGALPFSRANEAKGIGQAAAESEVFLLKKEHFTEMIRDQHALVEALVHTMTSRVREFTRNQQQTEKLTALGKLSAGLAHELNNPAAAIVRASDKLQKLLSASPETLQQLASLCLTTDKAALADELLNQALAKAKPTELSMLEKSEAEDDLAAWLKQNEVKQAGMLAERFVEYGLKQEQLKKLQECLPEGFNALLTWLYQRLQSRQLALEIYDSSQRISALVGAIKSYSHMDRSPEQMPARLAAHIRDTFTMLNHKLRKKNIQHQLDEEPGMPEVCVRIGEMNQVWTNLIDNAIDAAPEKGHIKVSIRKENDMAKVTIEDNGEGIPEEISAQVFDPFFTTKKIGEGSGMGLDIAKKLVEGHKGSLTLQSEPGCTQFTVCLPIKGQS